MDISNFLNFNLINSKSLGQPLKSINLLECCFILKNTKCFGQRFTEALQVLDIVNDLNVFGITRCVYYLNRPNYYNLFPYISYLDLSYLKNNVYLILNKPEKSSLCKSLLLTYLKQKNFCSFFKLETNTTASDSCENIKIFLAAVLLTVEPLLYQQITEYSQQNKANYNFCVLQKLKYNSFQEDIETVLSCIKLEYKYRHLNKEQKKKCVNVKTK